MLLEAIRDNPEELKKYCPKIDDALMNIYSL